MVVLVLALFPSVKLHEDVAVSLCAAASSMRVVTVGCLNRTDFDGSELVLEVFRVPAFGCQSVCSDGQEDQQPENALSLSLTSFHRLVVFIRTNPA